MVDCQLVAANAGFSAQLDLKTFMNDWLVISGSCGQPGLAFDGFSTWKMLRTPCAGNRCPSQWPNQLTG